MGFVSVRALLAIVVVAALNGCDAAETPASEPEEGQASAQVEVNPSESGTTSSTSKPRLGQKFVVALDAGHSRIKSGAISSHGVPEYDFNRRVVAELYDLLRSSTSLSPIRVNRDGDEVSLPKRSLEANQAGADLFLSIHHDSAKDQFLKDWKVEGKTQKYTHEFHGYSVFYSRKNRRAEQSLAFAEMLGRALRRAEFTPTLHHAAQEHRPVVDATNGIYAFDDLIVLKTATMPAVLLECGVILNPEEEEQLNSQPIRKRLERAITSAVEEFAAQGTKRSIPQAGE